MGAWGHGLFENDHDQDIAGDLGHEAGLDELQKATEGKVKERLAKEQPDRKKAEAIEPYYTLCGGGDAQEEIRAHLESGVLETLFAKKEQEMLHPPKHAWLPDYQFVLLGACAMTLGCRIPPRYKTLMQKHFLHVGILETGERQLFKALNGPDGYKEGVPYEFEVPADVEAAYEAEMQRREAAGGFVMMNVPAPHSLFGGPPKNKTLRAAMEEGKFGQASCGGCGADEKEDGGPLLRCAKCKKRGYCSVGCQKEHWKLHKKVCVAVEADGEKEDATPGKK